MRSEKEIIVRAIPTNDLDSGMDPVFRRILASRGVVARRETAYRLEDLIAPEHILNLDRAAELLADQIEAGGELLIFGDYDADGATSTALCVRALSLLGHKRLSFVMPDRMVDGYGLSATIAQAIAAKKPDCVITVDNGISSHEGIGLLRDNGISVIVTDHHLAAESLPPADVIVNQNAWPEADQGKNLAGVGIAFYLMLALRKSLRERQWFNESRSEPNLATCLDLVALGTLADLVPLDHNNRILVNEGLRRIRAGSGCQGIKALVEVSGKSLETLSSTDISFAIAPRINAAGRLDDMTVGVRCLLAGDAASAMGLAKDLNEINLQRREIQQQMSEQAMQQLVNLGDTAFDQGPGVVLYQPDWHEGIVGIVAARIREASHRPSIVFAMADDGLLKGSGRSIPGIHLLDMVDKRLPGVIVKFGGHAMAAGLSIEASALEAFSQGFRQVITETVDAACFSERIECDGSLEARCFDLGFAEALQQISPWGQQFPAPSFIGEFEVLEHRVLNDQHLKLLLRPKSADGAGPAAIDAIAFSQPDEVLESRPGKIRMHYQLDVNLFRDRKSLQLIIRDILYLE